MCHAGSVIVGIVTAGVVGSASSAIAQTAVAHWSPPPVAEQVSQRQRGIDVQLVNVTLVEAIREISNRGDIVVSYADKLMENAPRVSLNAYDVNPKEALARVLKGTSLQLVTVGGRLTIVAMKPADTEEQGTITGKVIHAKTKQPVAGVQVTVDGDAKGITTAADGIFRIPTSSGEHVIHIRGMGFTRQSRTVTVKSGETVTLEVVMEPSASVLNEVIVTGTVVATERKAIPTPITVITAEELEQRNITRIEQLFRGEVPGVVALEMGNTAYQDEALGAMASSTMYSRGSASLTGSANPIKTYVDGVELLDPSYLGAIDPQSVDRIEIITGPQAATIYGSGAIGGVMQIFTKKGADGSGAEMTLNLKYGMLQSNMSSGLTPAHNHSLSVSGGGAQFSYSTNLSYNYTGQWQPYLFSRTYGAQVGVSYSAGALIAGGSLALTSGENGTSGHGSVTFGGLGGLMVGRTLRGSGEWEAEFSSRGWWTQRRSGSSSQNLAANVDYRLFSTWQHHVTVGRNQTGFDLKPTAPKLHGFSDTLFRFRDQFGSRTSVTYNMTFTGAPTSVITSNISLGVNGSFSKNVSYSGNLPTLSSTAYLVPSVTRMPEGKNWGGFGQWQIGFFENVYLTLALRGERNADYGSDHPVDWSPTNGITYSFDYGNMTVKLLAAYGSATRAPNASYRLELREDRTEYEPLWVKQLAAPDLRPERSAGPQGGVEVYYGSRGSFTINRYRQMVSDMIQYVPVDSVWWTHKPSGYSSWGQVRQYQNVAQVQQTGWESTGSLVLGALSFRGTYTWNDSRVSSLHPKVPTKYHPGDGFIGVPTHLANVTLGYAFGGTSITMSSNYIGRMRANPLYTVLDRSQLYSRMPMYIERWQGTTEYAKPAYVKSDLSASQQLAPWATATLHITNLTDRGTSDLGNLFPALGRQTLLGISFRYPRR